VTYLIILAEVESSKEFIKCCKRLSKKHEKRILDKLEEVKYTMSNNTVEGDLIAKNLIPKIYRDKYHVNNLWLNKIDSYRLLYTIITEVGKKIYFLLNILSHNEYEQLMHY
jgi:mRNA-degrading endonuclease RelE of RelBE toxin-antitoxin system